MGIASSPGLVDRDEPFAAVRESVDRLWAAGTSLRFGSLSLAPETVDPEGRRSKRRHFQLAAQCDARSFGPARTAPRQDPHSLLSCGLPKTAQGQAKSSHPASTPHTSSALSATPRLWYVRQTYVNQLSPAHEGRRGGGNIF